MIYSDELVVGKVYLCKWKSYNIFTMFLGFNEEGKTLWCNGTGNSYFPDSSYTDIPNINNTGTVFPIREANKSEQIDTNYINSAPTPVENIRWLNKKVATT